MTKNYKPTLRTIIERTAEEELVEASIIDNSSSNTDANGYEIPRSIHGGTEGANQTLVNMDEALQNFNLTISEDEKKLLVKNAQISQALHNPGEAKVGYQAVQNILSNKDNNQAKLTLILEKQKASPVDFGLSSFFSFIAAMLELDDEKQSEVELAKVMTKFAFLGEDNLSQDKRITKVIEAQRSISGEGATEVITTGAQEKVQGDDQPSQPQEAPALSDASKKKIQEKITKDREKFLKEAAEGSKISGKAMAITAGKAATCIALSVAIPGFGLFAAVAFLYLTRGVGNDDRSKENELKEKLEQAELRLDGTTGGTSRAGFIRVGQDGGYGGSSSTEGENHQEVGKKNNAVASDKVAGNALKDLGAEKTRLEGVKANLQGRVGMGPQLEVGFKANSYLKKSIIASDPLYDNSPSYIAEGNSANFNQLRSVDANHYVLASTEAIIEDEPLYHAGGSEQSDGNTGDNNNYEVLHIVDPVLYPLANRAEGYDNMMKGGEMRLDAYQEVSKVMSNLGDDMSSKKTGSANNLPTNKDSVGKGRP